MRSAPCMVNMCWVSIRRSSTEACHERLLGKQIARRKLKPAIAAEYKNDGEGHQFADDRRAHPNSGAKTPQMKITRRRMFTGFGAVAAAALGGFAIRSAATSYYDGPL